MLHEKNQKTNYHLLSNYLMLGVNLLLFSEFSVMKNTLKINQSCFRITI